MKETAEERQRSLSVYRATHKDSTRLADKKRYLENKLKELYECGQDKIKYRRKWYDADGLQSILNEVKKEFIDIAADDKKNFVAVKLSALKGKSLSKEKDVVQRRRKDAACGLGPIIEKSVRKSSLICQRGCFISMSKMKDEDIKAAIKFNERRVQNNGLHSNDSSVLEGSCYELDYVDVEDDVEEMENRTKKIVKEINKYLDHDVEQTSNFTGRFVCRIAIGNIFYGIVGMKDSNDCYPVFFEDGKMHVLPSREVMLSVMRDSCVLSSRYTAVKNAVEDYMAKTGLLTNDLLVAVAFLVRRVQSPDIDDWDKMCRFVKYIEPKQ